MSIKNIYIIDDEPQAVEVLSEYIQLMEYTVTTFTEAEVFFKEITEYQENSLMILDLNMPVMDGIEVMRQMVKTGRLLPLILVSGYDSGVLHSAEQLAKAYSLDIVATIEKPFKLNYLHEIIQGYKETQTINRPKEALTLSTDELENAILTDQLEMHYQPQINIKTGKVLGLEALVRWQHPEHGLIFPDSFISLAENNNLIGDLTARVIKLSLEQALKWQSEDINLHISVNISSENIKSLLLPEQLSKLLKLNSLSPSVLTLEVTESSLMGQLVTSLDILTRLRMKGIELSIDDFGTGYSSLSQLYRMPFTELKVDKSFVMNLNNDEEARGIVKTCIMLGHELKMLIVAEGVENKDILNKLNEMGCDIAQGYYIARPMPAAELSLWLKNYDASKVISG